MRADARCLPFRDRTFDTVFCSPPWDDPQVLVDARPELTRVLTRKGRMIMLLPHMDDRKLASLVVTNRDWTERQSWRVSAPRERLGPRYFSPADDFVAGVLRRFPARRLLDPFAGVHTIPRVARSLGAFAVGCDIA